MGSTSCQGIFHTPRTQCEVIKYRYTDRRARCSSGLYNDRCRVLNKNKYYNNGIKGIIVYDLLYDRIEIEYIIVDVEYRKRGIGTLLLNEIEQKAADVSNDSRVASNDALLIKRYLVGIITNIGG